MPAEPGQLRAQATAPRRRGAVLRRCPGRGAQQHQGAVPAGPGARATSPQDSCRAARVPVCCPPCLRETRCIRQIGEGAGLTVESCLDTEAMLPGPCKSADPQTTSRRVGGAAGPGEGGKRGRTRRRRHLRQCARNALAHVSRVVLSCRRRCWSRGRQSKRCRAGKQAMLAPRCQRTITYAHNRKPLT